MAEASPKDKGAAIARAVEEKVKASGTSFYWAMRFQPAEKRRALFAVYAFCRAVDDIADSPAQASVKAKALKAWRREIENLFKGKPGNVITRALQPALKEYTLEKKAFLALIEGMEMDAAGPIVAPSWKILDLYCARVACAVGLLCIRVFGEGGKEGKAVADALGRALQLTNILRDLKEDAATGRLYLPRELLAKHGIKERRPEKVLTHPGIEPVCGEILALAEKEFARAERAIAKCDPKAIRPAAVMKDVYKSNLTRLKARGFSPKAIAKPENALAKPVRKIEKLFIALKSLA
ncbi:MAG TPA: presqualene diphosphate synthase HpnD [Sphingomonadales bacterium]|nr:presqualene diphosphate synthase HpnD [Sphingomonadales bacterium]